MLKRRIANSIENATKNKRVHIVHDTIIGVCLGEFIRLAPL